MQRDVVGQTPDRLDTVACSPRHHIPTDLNNTIHRLEAVNAVQRQWLRFLGSCGHAQAAIWVKGPSPVLSASGPYTSAAGTRCRILPAVQCSSK